MSTGPPKVNPKLLLRTGVFLRDVPSIENILKRGDEAYFRFASKWGPSADARGAMHAILYAHGHKAAWTDSLLEASLFFAGFKNLTKCEPHFSDHEEMEDVEGHHRIIGDKFNAIESCIVEGEADHG